MWTSRQPTRLCQTVAIALLILTSASDALARNIWLARPPARIQRSQPSYAGDCGPNPPPGYRWDLKGWRSGDDRDFYCYMLDEY